MRYRCSIYGYIYDDSKEDVPFSELPEDWRCPVCGATKDDFEEMDDDTPEPAVPVETVIDDDMTRLSVGQMAALCSNLAQGCEKQHLEKESKNFKKIADYLTSVSPAVPGADIDAMAEMLMKDTSERYPTAVFVGDRDGDRGALRVCAWGEKITRMLDSLLKSYMKYGESFLEETEIWVCTVCGFVYVGDNPPEKCPVCSVPAWKFRKVTA